MSEYFPKPRILGGNVKVELDLLIMRQKKILKMKVFMQENLLKRLI